MMPAIFHLKNFLKYSLGVWISAVISFFTSPLLSYLIAPEEYGKAMMFTTVYSILFLVVQLGLNESFLRFYYEVRPEERGSLLYVCLVPGLLALSVVSLLLMVFNRKVSQLLVLEYNPTVSLYLVLSIFFGMISMYSQRIIRMRKQGLLFSAMYLIQYLSNSLISIGLLTLYKKTYHSLVISQVFSNFITAVFGISLTYDEWEIHTFDRDLFQKVLKYGLPMIPSGLLMWLFNWIDRISLRMFSDFREIGLYSAAFKLTTIVGLFSTGFFQFWQPLMFEKVSAEDKRFFHKSFNAVGAAVVLLSAAVIAVSDIVFLIFSKDYRSAARISPFLVLGASTQILLYVANAGIEYSKKTFWYPVTLLFSSVFNFLLNLGLIQIIGARGAAISTGLSYLLLLFLRTKISLRYLNFGVNKLRTILSFFVVSIEALHVTFSSNPGTNLLCGLIALLLLALINQRFLVGIFVQIRRELSGFICCKKRS